MSKRERLQTTSARGLLWVKQALFSEGHWVTERSWPLSVMQYLSAWTNSLSCCCGCLLTPLCSGHPHGSVGNLPQSAVGQQCHTVSNKHHLLWKCFLLVRAVSLESGLCAELLPDQYRWYPAMNDLHWFKRSNAFRSCSMCDICSGDPNGLYQLFGEVMYVFSAPEELQNNMLIYFRSTWGCRTKLWDACLT